MTTFLIIVSVYFGIGLLFSHWIGGKYDTMFDRIAIAALWFPMVAKLVYEMFKK